MIEGEGEQTIPEIHSMKTVQRPASKNSSFFQYKLKIHTQYNQVQRETYQILNFLGDIGGFFSILTLVGFMLAERFSQFILRAEIFEKIYQIKRFQKEKKLANSRG